MTATTTLADHSIAAFAADVRAHLDDLPADDVDDLLDGLEADLAEQAADSGDDFSLPDAAAYADELRTAAGLPERQPIAARAPWRARVGERIAGQRDALHEGLRNSRAGAWTLDLLVSIRPGWWVLRGWALYAALSLVVGAPPLPTNGVAGFVLLLALVLVSIQGGRGRWMPRRWLRGLRTLASVIAVVVLPFALAAATSWASGAYGYSDAGMEYVDVSQPGLTLDGQRVRNIFAYDADGNPIDSVQLYDQDGRALTTTGDIARDEAWTSDMYFFGGGGPVPVPVTGTGRQAVWNVFPLRELPTSTWENPDVDVDEAEAPVFPYPQVPGLGAGTTPSASPSPTPAPETTPGATPAPDPAPSDPAGSADPADPAETPMAPVVP